jgi:hypothetical protein
VGEEAVSETPATEEEVMASVIRLEQRGLLRRTPPGPITPETKWQATELGRKYVEHRADRGGVDD